jgi:ABC-type glutathione transport system ATPase component
MKTDDPIVVSDLSAEYAQRGASASCVALRGVSFRVPRGHVLGVLGESGSGKSTLARLLAGRTADPSAGENPPRITGGEATVLGHSLRRLRGRARASLTFHAGYLPQDAGTRLDPSSTVAENIAQPIFERDKHFSKKDAGERVAQLLDAVQLPLRMLGDYPYELSSGQRQRVGIARSLVLGPELLIADEPTAGIDVTVRESVVALLSGLQTHEAFTAVLVTHDLAVLRQVRATLAVLHQGALVGYGPIDEVLTNPTHPYVANLARTIEAR